ncbi:hypothetical protein cypCar_00010020 [Cyprinus carpio]|nr:hypothetical protein cypCar_00010020 [Cyprinus carpio]
MPAPGVCLNIVSERNLKDGQGSPNNPEKFLDQDFHRLKLFCLKERLRFVDNLFPPEIKSIGLGSLAREDLQRVVWRRPHELVPNPVYIVHGASRFDIIQGNCWFLASVGALTSQKRIMKQVINDEQSFSVDYAGIFHFKFWRYGSWVDVVIDDKLPTFDGRLIFVHSKTPNEFWPALLEKAYAKVCGSYADMDIGSISEALMDFTGGPHMTIKLSDASGKLWETMRRAGQSESLMGCGTPGGQAGLLKNKVLPNGLVEMHAYAITGVAEEPVEDPSDESSPNLLVSLIQKSHKRNRHLATNFHIGFNIYEVPAHLKNQREKYPASFFKTNPIGKTKTFLNAREVMEFFRFKAGEYLIVPSTFLPNEAASFLLTVYSKTETIIEDSSGYGMTRTKMIPRDNDESFQLFLQYADEYGEVDAERLQRLLNENLYAGHSQKKTGFSLDLCKSLVALMDDIFYDMDVSHTGSLSLNELRNALKVTGFVLSDSMLNLMALRYGDSNGEITLENFIVLVLRMDCMASNCWFLASVGALTFQKPIMKQVINDEQSFSVDYAGIFHFKFWRFGSWLDVVIDDKLPTIDGRLVFVQSKTPNEFWPALLEKAYAKVCGSYADMDAGSISEALMDFTGGPHMTIKLSDASGKLWETMRRASQSESLMGCGTPGGQAGLLQNNVLPSGLVEMHAYTVTGVAEVVCKGRPVKLVRIFNPWGHGEWNRDWSDRSPLWKLVRPEDQKYKVVLDNGEFCFSRNPQFHVTLKEPVEGPRDESSPNLLVSLIQKSHKRNRHLATNFHIGFNIYEVPAHLKDQREKFPASFFRNARLVGKNESYINTREIMEFFRFKAGEYLIVPSTYKPNEAASFLLTVYSKTEAIIKDSSGYGMTRKKMIPRDNDESFQLFPQYADKYGEVDAERLQRLLNENLYAGHSQKKTGFSLDLCKSLVALMDVSSNIRDIFYGKDVSRTGSLSLNELRNALTITGFVLSDSMLNLMALRYGDSNGEITLENFIVLVLRMDCMAMDASNHVLVIQMRLREWILHRLLRPH